MPESPFIPHPLLAGGHLQTLAGQLLGRPPRVDAFIAETLALPDGDRLLIHVNEPTAATAAPRPVVLLLHGLGGSSESSYILRLTRRLNSIGLTVARFNHRGCGHGGAPLARRIYHAGRVDDLAAFVAWAHARWPDRPLLAAGFSLSANMLLRWLGEADVPRAAPRLERALAVCPPVDLERCSQALSRRDNWHIDRHFTRGLVREALARASRFPDDPAPAFPARLNLRVFDEVYTAPRAGFPSRDEYYAVSSARRSVHAIVTPTTVLAAADDPIIPAASFDGVRWSPAVRFRLERSGGHMGFISRAPTRFRDHRWMDAFVVAWVEGAGAELASPSSDATTT